MLAPAVPRIIEDRGRRPGAPERPVFADIDPAARRVGLAFGEDRHGRVIAMQALGGEHMGFDQLAQRIERGRDRTDRVSHGRERDRRALQGIALALPVQRLMLAELPNMIIASRLGPAHPLGTT